MRPLFQLGALTRNGLLLLAAQAATLALPRLFSLAAVVHPLSVRRAWSNDSATANLSNRGGLPVAPFRSHIP